MYAKSNKKVISRLTLIAMLITLSKAALAENLVSLYGIINTGVAYVDNTNGQSKVFMQSGAFQSNRFGLTGVEDLGGGLQAIFKLEAGFDSTNGASTGAGGFSRWAYVGLRNDWGTITAGRVYDFTTYYVVQDSNVAVHSLWMGSYLDANRIAGEFVNNAVMYESPVVAGLKVGAMWGFSNAAGSFGGEDGAPRTISAGAQYKVNAAEVDFAFTGINGTGNSVAQTLLGASRSWTVALGGNYRSGKFRYHGVLSTAYFGGMSNGESERISNVDVGLDYFFSPAFYVTPGAMMTWNGGNRFGQLALSGDYALSKRTDLSVGVFWARSFTAGFSPVMLSVLQTVTSGGSTTANQLAFQTSIRLKF